MKKFLKKASIYVLVLLLIAAAVFSLNFFLGRRLAQDLERDIEKIADENNYQLRYLSINTNPLLRRVEINGLSLLKSSEQSLEINGANIELTWQQIFNYLKDRNFLTKKDITADVDKFTFYDLQQNNNFSFYNSSVRYQGEINSEILKDPMELIKHNHQLTILAEEFDYDYPYYRSYGISKDNWERISSFKDFAFNASYLSQDKQLNLNDFVLKNEFIDYELDFESIIAESDKKEVELKSGVEETAENETEPIEALDNSFQEIVLYSSQESEIGLKELKSNYQLALDGEILSVSENDLFNELSFNDFELASAFEIYLNSTARIYEIQKFDLELNLNEFSLNLAESLSNQVNEISFGILAQDNDFVVDIDSLKYQQQYTRPQGKSEFELVSSLIDAQLNAEFNYSEETPYISNSFLRFKANNPSVEQLLLFTQLLSGERFNQDEEGFYYLEGWGNIDDLNFE